MAVGDVVNGVFNNATTMVFRPAAGVEIAITSTYSHATNVQLTDGTTSSIIYYSIQSLSLPSNTKIMINNTIWLTASGASSIGSSYSGIQIK
jgi:hypothetical protein